MESVTLHLLCCLTSDTIESLKSEERPLLEEQFYITHSHQGAASEGWVPFYPIPKYDFFLPFTTLQSMVNYMGLLI